MTTSRSRACLATITIALAGCSGGPVNYLATTPQPTGDTFACALRLVNEHGFTVTSASRDGGFLAAEKRRSGALNVVLGREEVDRLTVSIYDDAVPGRRKVRVTVSAMRVAQGGSGRAPASIGPSEEVTGDAQRLLATCANGSPSGMRAAPDAGGVNDARSR